MTGSPKSASLTIRTDQVTTVAGMRGTGKTTLMRRLVQSTPRAWVLDPLDQYGDLGRHCIVPGEKGAPADERDCLEALCRRAWASGNVTIFAEEAELALPEKKTLLPYTQKVILRGRNRGIGFTACTRRIAELKKTVFSLSDHVLIFAFFADVDISYLTGFMGKEAEQVRALRDFHFYHYEQRGGLVLMPPLTL